jgi:hypothetical protein
LFRSLRKRRLIKRLGPPVVVVSGLPRSGTSMMMKMLDAAGVELFADHIRTPDEDNPKGYFEYEPVKELDKSADKSWVKECRGKAVKIISFLLPHLPDDCYYRVVFMQRDLHEVMASQQKMLERRGEPIDEDGGDKMIGIWQRHLRKVAFQLKQQDNVDILDVGHRDVLSAPREQARKVSEFLGGKFDLEAMAGVVDPQLYRNRRSA